MKKRKNICEQERLRAKKLGKNENKINKKENYILVKISEDKVNDLVR